VVLIVGPYVPSVSVRKRLDQLLAEPVVADFGYPTDHAMIARLVRGLQLLADELDALATRMDEGPDAQVIPHRETQGRPVTPPSPEPSFQPAHPSTPAQDALSEYVGNGSPISLE
jgi:hypothetical protein